MQSLVNIGVTKEKEDASIAALNLEKSKAAANLAEAVALKEKAIADLNNVEERYIITRYHIVFIVFYFIKVLAVYV